MMKKMLTSLGLFLVGGLVATAVSASTITIDQEHFATNPTVECEGCMGFYVPGYDPTAPDLTGLILDSEWATGFTGIGSTDSEELAGLNTLLGALSMAPVTDVKKTDFEPDGTEFTTSSQYFSVKKDGWIAYFMNTSGGALTVRMGAGWSHFTEYGNAIPIPSAVLLFGSALLGLAGIGARRRLGSA